MEDSEQGLVAWLEYNSDLFDASTITRMLAHFQTLLEGIVAHPEYRLSNLPLLAEAEHLTLVEEWNRTATDYPKDLCIHQLFEAQVERTPDAVAVEFEDQQLTYFELNCRANQLAHYLHSLGVRPEVLVGICLERSLLMVVGLLAILKAGGAYVPLDPAYPQERLTFMLKDARVSVLLTQQHLAEKLPEHTASIVYLDSNWETNADDGAQSHTDHSIENLTSKVTPDNLAYVIYTSGSTGTPKGVRIVHRGVVRLVKENNYANLSAEQVFLQLAPISFDASTFEIWGSQLNGGRLVVMPAHMPSLQELGLALRQYQVTILWLTAGLFHLMVDERLSDLELVGQLLAGGDVLSVSHVQKVHQLLKECQLIDCYGPTENTTFTSCYAVPRGTEIRNSIPIGRPIANTQVYLLDEQLQPVPIGVPGELYIGGDGLARDYLNRPQLTAEKFIPNPFSSKPGERLYKTGDHARYLPNGNIEYLGRLDNQVKIRGFRIELAEIESVLQQHPGVRESVVIAREDVPGNKRLVAYVVVNETSGSTIGELHHFLKAKLPEYMVPSAIVILETLPLTPNGKVDRRALPVPETTRPELSGKFVKPRTPIEEMLAVTWADILGVQNIGIHDNFFELGGHSLLATQVVSRLRDTFCVELPLRVLFEAPTVAGLAEHIDTARRASGGLHTPPLVPIKRDTHLPLSFAQARLWFLDQLEPGSAVYNIPAAVRLSGSLDVAALQQSFNEIVRRHETLHTTFMRVDGEPIVALAPVSSFKLTMVDLRELAPDEQSTEVSRLIALEAQRPFDLSNGPLLRATLLQLNQTEHVLLVVMHHIISDGWSMGVLIRELAALYEAYSREQPLTLPELPIQYADFAHWQRQWLSGEVLQAQLEYWKQQLAGAPPVLELPTDRPRPPVQTFRGASQSLALPEPLSQGLKALSQRYGVTLFMTLLAAFQTLLYRYTGQSDICVGSPIANRNRSETESLIGFFVNTLVLRTQVSGNASFSELLARVREVALNAYAHQDLPFEQLVEALQPERNLSHQPLFQVMFVLQNAPMPTLELPGLSLNPLSMDSTIAKFDLTLSMEDTDRGLVGWLEYNSDLFDASTINRMLAHFQTLLEGIVAHPEHRLANLPLLTPQNQHQLLVEWNDNRTDYPKQQCIHQLFEAEVERSPDKVAVVFEDQQLTYSELNRRANQLAYYLRSLGVGPEALVGICLERSLLMVVGLLGILKAGGAYVPLDPTLPIERLAFMLGDAQVPVLLTQQHLVAKLPIGKTEVVCLDAGWEANAYDSTTHYTHQNEENLTNDVQPNNLAYAMYTSGSTGIPKGIAVPHRGVVRLVKQTNYAELTAEEVFLQFAPISFDASTFEIWGCLLNGARLVVFPARMPSLEELGRILQQYQVTTLWLTAGLFNQMVEGYIEGLEQVRQLLAGGDVLSVSHVQTVLQKIKGCRLINGYGPTEGTTFTCGYPITTADRVGISVPIGRPLSNTQVYILDSHLQPLPIGVPGELYIGGDGLARGYLNQPGLTAKKFIPNPFSSDPGACLYKTGDLARYNSDSNIEFLGRLDHQVKLRGFRIDLPEIEVTLSHHPAVHEVVVTAREDAPGNKRLVAYVVPKQDREEPTIAEMRRFLVEKLPDYMVPSAFVLLSTLPLTPNGKVDRKALPSPQQGVRPELTADYVAPQSELERTIAIVWQEVLQVEKVGIHDNFFDLGGHSLLVIQVHGKLRQALDWELSMVDIFQYPTISALANYYSQQQSERPSFEHTQERAQGRKDLMKQQRQLRQKNRATNNLARGS
ncbi:amino acid adenylation domain-containing protein [Scytonema sp. NUACC21]